MFCKQAGFLYNASTRIQEEALGWLCRHFAVSRKYLLTRSLHPFGKTAFEKVLRGTELGRNNARGSGFSEPGSSSLP